ncbi:metallophosphoesterase [Sorangium sp. So ce1182]|uniref:metallophosphoesterase n=1 Tax=Sorangium sp. So ce1182 TaxID=3133334 RepID=UPI003F6393AB
MRTLILSDLHLGNGGDYDVFAGGEALPALLDVIAREPARVLVNGDGIDFLMNEDPLELDPARAAAQARAIVAAPESAAVLRALGRVLARGGEVIIRLGNHDVELAVPEVQEILRAAMEQPPAVAARLAFQLGDAPAILDVGGARILVTHGEHSDNWNKVDYGRLTRLDRFRYAAGSVLVKQLMNPIARRHGLRFVSLLKPDFQGAALAALAVAPGIVKQLFSAASLDIAWQLFKKAGSAASFAEEEEDLGLAERFAEAGLGAEEAAAVEAALGDGPAAFADEEAMSTASVKLARAGLKLYAGVQRRLAGTLGDEYFRLEPDEAEWADAQRLARKFDAGAVVIGHTHAARWKAADGLVFANTGTWIWLMQLPRSDAGDEAWAEFIDELRQNPKLLPEKQRAARTLQRFTAVLLDAHEEGGAAMWLVHWDHGELRSLGAARVPPASAAR